MAKPHIHAASSAKRFGGVWEDYVDIHAFLDSSKATVADNRHRLLTHNSWFVQTVIPRVFGLTRKNSADKTYSTVEVAERHVLEDYRMKFIPSPTDFLNLIPVQEWMNNGLGKGPPSTEQL